MGGPPLFQRLHCILQEAANDWVGTKGDVLVSVSFTEGALPDSALSISGESTFQMGPSR